MELLFSLLGEILVPVASVVLEVLLALLGDTFGWVLEGIVDWFTGNRRKPAENATIASPTDAEGKPLFGRAKPEARQAANVVDRGDDGGSVLPGILFNATLGLLVGIGSILVLPTHFITSPLLRLLAIPASAVACGLIVPRVGRLLRGDRPGRSLATGSFADAFVFALVFSLLRYFGAH